VAGAGRGHGGHVRRGAFDRLPLLKGDDFTKTDAFMGGNWWCAGLLQQQQCGTRFPSIGVPPYKGNTNRPAPPLPLSGRARVVAAVSRRRMRRRRPSMVSLSAQPLARLSTGVGVGGAVCTDAASRPLTDSVVVRKRLQQQGNEALLDSVLKPSSGQSRGSHRGLARSCCSAMDAWVAKMASRRGQTEKGIRPVALGVDAETWCVPIRSLCPQF
jgi:hypothetical protein